MSTTSAYTSLEIKRKATANLGMMATKIRFDAVQLPDRRQASMDFLDSSFFQDHESGKSLPTPAEVRALNSNSTANKLFDHLNLLVKYGPSITISEAQSLWMVNKLPRERVPVPEIYDWRVDGRDVFIYTELIHLETLKHRREFLSIEDKTAVCDQLHQMIGTLREVEQNPQNQFIGKIGKKSPPGKAN